MEMRTHPLGFKEVWPKPTPEDLEAYYNANYYGDANARYAVQEMDVESRRKNPPLVVLETFSVLSLPPTGRILELASGTGHYLFHFYQRGWDVTGTELTLDGIQHFFPELPEHILVGDVFEVTNQLIQNGQTYDLVVSNHLLEHVREPLQLVESIYALLKPGGYARIAVPNDDSPLFHEIVTQGFADPDFWVQVPDHLSYFNRESFTKLLSHSGLNVVSMLADFPVELYLLNPHSNYKQDPTKGKGAHQAKKLFEQFLARQSIEQMVAFRRGCAEAGIGRRLIAYCQKPVS